MVNNTGANPERLESGREEEGMGQLLAPIYTICIYWELFTNNIEFHRNTGMRMGEGGEGGWVFSHPKSANAFMNITNNGSVI